MSARHPLRIRVLAAKDTAQLVTRVWFLHRRTGIPYVPLFQAHIQALDSYRSILEEAVAELRDMPIQAPMPAKPKKGNR